MAWKISKCAMSAANPTVRVPPCLGSAAASGVPMIPKHPATTVRNTLIPTIADVSALRCLLSISLSPFVPLSLHAHVRNDFHTLCMDVKIALHTGVAASPKNGYAARRHVVTGGVKEGWRGMCVRHMQAPG